MSTACAHPVHILNEDVVTVRCMHCGQKESRRYLVHCESCAEWRPLYNMSNDTMCNIYVKCSYCMMPYKNPTLQTEITWKH